MDAFLETIVRRREQVLLGTAESSLRRGLRRGTLVRITAGVYAESSAWESLKPIEQHRERVLATAARLHTTPVFSHFAAAALWGIRILGRWPEFIDVTLGRATGGRSDGRLRRHCTGIEATEVRTVDGLLVTSPAQTVVDLARLLPFTDAVVALDSALHRHRLPSPLATREDIDRIVASAEGRSGYRKARAAAACSTHLSDSPKESQSRVVIRQLGFPEPVLQQEFRLANGRTAETDFFWPDFSQIGECDGRAKYTDPALMRGRTSAQVFFAEKERENELRRMVRAFSRWEPHELDSPRRLYDRLVRDGLPSSKLRPR